MHWLDWLIVAVFCALSMGLGLLRRREGNLPFDNPGRGFLRRGTRVERLRLERRRI